MVLLPVLRVAEAFDTSGRDIRRSFVLRQPFVHHFRNGGVLANEDEHRWASIVLRVAGPFFAHLLPKPARAVQSDGARTSAQLPASDFRASRHALPE